jgi:hypothetical protein
MKDLLNTISVLSTLVLVLGIVYFILNNTVGRLILMRWTGEQVLRIKTILLLALSVLLVCISFFLKVIAFYKPW